MTMPAHENRLRYVTFRPLDLGAIATFDRQRNRAVVYTLASILPIDRKTIRLTDIEDIKVRKHENEDETASYGVVLRVKTGNHVRFWCASRHQALRILREATHFLRLDEAAEANQPLADPR